MHDIDWIKLLTWAILLGLCVTFWVILALAWWAEQ